MLIKLIPLKFGKKTNKKYALIIIITVKTFWKTFDDKEILFLAKENLQYVKLVKMIILKKLSYFETPFRKRN